MNPQEYEMADLGADDNVAMSYAEAIRILDSVVDVRREYNSRFAYLETLKAEAPEFLRILAMVYSEKIDAFSDIIKLIDELGEQNNLARQLSEIKNDVISRNQRNSQLIARRVQLEEEKTKCEITAKWAQQDSQEDIPALAILRDIKNTSYGGTPKRDLFTSCCEKIVEIGESIKDINNQILEISKNIDALKKKTRVLIEENRVLLSEIRDRLAHARVIIDFIEDLEKKIADFKTLFTMGDTLHALAIRGDTAHDDIVRLLSEGRSPNDLDHLRSKKPIYYACMCGHVRLATLFVDVTEFNGEDKRKILEELPDIKGLWDLRSIIQYGTTNFNRLWNPNGGIEDNIIKIFKDYYSPVIFDHYDLFGEGLGERLRLILTGAWHRHNIDDAREIVKLFTTQKRFRLEPIALVPLFEGQASYHHHRHGPEEINHEGTFYKRLMFVLQQLKKKRYKSSSERVNLPSLPLDIFEEDRGSQKMERGSQKVLPSIKMERGSQKVLPSIKMERGSQKVLPSIKMERGSQKVLPSIPLDVFKEDRGRQEMESVYDTMSRQPLPGLKYQSIPGNGHCLFNAVALYCGKDQQALRNLVAGHIEYNMEEYRNIIQALNSEKTPELYLQEVRQGIEWADNLEIAVLMAILNRPIVVVGTDGKITNLSDLNGDGVPIFVQYNGHNHYDALILTGEKDAGEIFEALKQLCEDSQEARNRSPLLFSSVANREAQERQQEERELRELEEARNRSWETYQREHGSFANDAEREVALTNFRQEWDNELRVRRAGLNLT